MSFCFDGEKKKKRKHTHKSVKAAISVTFIYDINNLYYCTCTTCVFCTAVPGEVSWYWGGSYHQTCKTPVTILFYLVFFPHHDHQTLLTFSSHIHLVIYFSLFKVFVPDTSCLLRVRFHCLASICYGCLIIIIMILLLF